MQRWRCNGGVGRSCIFVGVGGAAVEADLGTLLDGLGMASTDGGLLTCAVTVMITESEDVAVSSLAVSVKAMAVSESTRGAVKVVDAEVALVR